MESVVCITKMLLKKLTPRILQKAINFERNLQWSFCFCLMVSCNGVWRDYLTVSFLILDASMWLCMYCGLLVTLGVNVKVLIQTGKAWGECQDSLCSLSLMRKIRGPEMENKVLGSQIN